MSKSTVNEDDLSSITSHFEPGEDVGTFWCRLCIASGTHKGKAYEAPRGRTNLMNHIKTHKNYESEWAAEKSRCDLDPSSTSNKMFVSEISERLFSRAKLVLHDRRKNLTFKHFEMLLFLWLNRDLWDIKTVQKCIVRHDTNEDIVEVYVDEFDMDLAENESDEAAEEI